MPDGYRNGISRLCGRGIIGMAAVNVNFLGSKFRQLGYTKADLEVFGVLYK